MMRAIATRAVRFPLSCRRAHTRPSRSATSQRYRAGMIGMVFALTRQAEEHHGRSHDPWTRDPDLAKRYHVLGGTRGAKLCLEIFDAFENQGIVMTFPEALPRPTSRPKSRGSCRRWSLTWIRRIARNPNGSSRFASGERIVWSWGLNGATAFYYAIVPLVAVPSTKGVLHTIRLPLASPLLGCVHLSYDEPCRPTGRLGGVPRWYPLPRVPGTSATHAKSRLNDWSCTAAWPGFTARLK
jgi:hypothetical protein